MNSGSYAWKSILKARKVISRGARWRVGDGSTIRVVADIWLTGNNGSQTLSPNNSLPSSSTVSTLIDQDSRDWNYHLIDAISTLVEANLIKAVPLCSPPQKDFLYWLMDKFGEYRVKASYKIPCEENRRDEASSSNREANRALWKGIWKMSTPGKIKHFLWKACSNALPVKTNLVKRKSWWKMSIRSVPRKLKQLPTPYGNVRCCRRCGVQNLDGWTETKQGMVHSVKVQHPKARRRTSYKHQIRRSKHGYTIEKDSIHMTELQVIFVTLIIFLVFTRAIISCSYLLHVVLIMCIIS